MSEHTPLPWEIVGRYIVHKGIVVAELKAQWDGARDLSIANGELIVSAVNHYAKLQTELRAMRSFSGQHPEMAQADAVLSELDREAANG